MTTSTPVHTVCPHCKRPVTVQPDQRRAQCPEHGVIVPMRSAIANPPLLPSTPSVVLLYPQVA
ncbi:MAG: hypothetical protein P9F19_10320 [Candidatus Contendobacter sp.]|nr:hypothetical protein [Candidatus Contendobacter sp.]